MPRGGIRLVVFDWAGTTVDHGSCAPVAPFVTAFARQSIELSTAEARGPMGVHKRDHVRALFTLPAVSDRWRALYHRDWTEADVESVYEEFVLLCYLEDHGDISSLAPDRQRRRGP